VAKDELRADIAAARARMRTKVGGGKEIKRLVGHLWEDEHVERMTTGSYGAGTGLLVLTDRRLLFVKEGMTKKTEDFPLENIFVGPVVVWTHDRHGHGFCLRQ
jgi:Bacterial PH domain